MTRITLLLLLVGVCVMLLVSVFLPPAVLQAWHQQEKKETCRTFPETGKTLCEPFLSYWRSRGGLDIFGYPLSDLFLEKSALDGKDYTVQYFERAVFEHHPENRPPYDVLLSQLGTFMLNLKHPEEQSGKSYLKNAPLYPLARDVTVEHGSVQTITRFTTADTATQVLVFYKEIMSKEKNWILYDEGPNRVAFDYRGSTDDGFVHNFIVTVASEPNLSRVTLTQNRLVTP